MVSFEFPCECGAPIRVSASQAGTNVTCACGRIVSIPSLSDLQNRFRIEKTNGDQEVAADRRGYAVSIIGVVVLLFVVWLWKLAPLAILLFALMFFGGKLWFLAVMFREMGAIAVLAFIIPFFDWLFLFIRFDVAWKPVCMQFLGLLFLAVGAT